MIRNLAIGVAAIGALAAFSPSGATTQDRVKTQCQVEVDAAELGDYEPRPKTVGFIKSVSGDVGVIRPTADNWSPPPVAGAKGMNILAQDAIVTGADDSSFVVIFKDSSILSGNANTCVEVTAYEDEDKSQSEFRLRLANGLVSIDAGDIAKIRGDTMSVKVRDDTNLAVTGTVLVVRAQ